MFLGLSQHVAEAVWRSGSLSRQSSPLQVPPWVRGGLGVGGWIPWGQRGSTVQAASVAARRGVRKLDGRLPGSCWETRVSTGR